MRAIKLLFTVIGTIPFLLAFSQDSSFVTIHYPAGLTAEKIYVDYSDGKNYFRKAFDSSSNITFNKPRYWRYADIVIYYPDTAHKRKWLLNTFWVGGQPADIYILPDSNGSNHYQRYRLKNAYNVADSGRNLLDLLEKPISDSLARRSHDLAQRHNSDSLEKVNALSSSIIL